MPETKKRGEMLEQTTIRIPFEHLSEAAQQVIGGSQSGTIGRARYLRRTAEAVGLAGGVLGVGAAHLIGAHYQSALIGSGIPTLGYRIKFSQEVQKAHNTLKEAVNKHGLLATKFEGHYPFNWVSAGVVAKTHPIFYVTARGDMVFKKPTRLEYMRYLD